VIRDERGAALVETMATFPVLFIFYLGLYMLVYMLAGHLMVLRAADASARAAIVFLTDLPLYYEGGRSPLTREEFIHAAAEAALLPSAHMRLDAVTWNTAKGFEPLRAEVKAHFDCSAFLAGFLCGPGRRVPMTAAVTLPYQEGFPDR
jgi:hypothetical protein